MISGRWYNFRRCLFHGRPEALLHFYILFSIHTWKGLLSSATRRTIFFVCGHARPITSASGGGCEHSFEPFYVSKIAKFVVPGRPASFVIIDVVIGTFVRRKCIRQTEGDGRRIVGVVGIVCLISFVCCVLRSSTVLEEGEAFC